MWIGHRKEIGKLTFGALAFRRILLPTDAAPVSLFRNLTPVYIYAPGSSLS